MRKLALAAALVCPVLACRSPASEPEQAAESSPAPVPGSERVAAPGPTIGEIAEEDAAGWFEQNRARSAWVAVRERGQLLGRRGQGGLVYGRLGQDADPGPGRWLVEESAGRGALALRLVLPEWAARMPAGDRIAVGGAWWRDADERRWVWRAEHVTRISGAPAAAFTAGPGLAIDTVAASDIPEDARRPDQPGPPGPVVLVVVGKPVRFGDGWPVAAEPGADPVAFLRLPGEQPIYGGDELLADDERWSLRVGARYLVDSKRIVVPRRTGALPLVRATGAPRRIR